MILVEDNSRSASVLKFRMAMPLTPADVAVARVTVSETVPHHLADRLTDRLKRLFAPRRVSRLVCRPAWELTGITRVDRYDIAPWLFH